MGPPRTDTCLGNVMVLCVVGSHVETSCLQGPWEHPYGSPAVLRHAICKCIYIWYHVFAPVIRSNLDDASVPLPLQNVATLAMMAQRHGGPCEVEPTAALRAVTYSAADAAAAACRQHVQVALKVDTLLDPSAHPQTRLFAQLRLPVSHISLRGSE